jgi:hypothetical protein
MAHLQGMQDACPTRCEFPRSAGRPYVYESQGVAIPNRCVVNYDKIFPLVQIEPSSTGKCVKSPSHFPGVCWFFNRSAL